MLGAVTAFVQVVEAAAGSAKSPGVTLPIARLERPGHPPGLAAKLKHRLESLRVRLVIRTPDIIVNRT